MKSKKSRKNRSIKVASHENGSSPDIHEIVRSLRLDSRDIIPSSRQKSLNADERRRLVRGRGEENTTIIEGDDGATYIFNEEDQ